MDDNISQYACRIEKLLHSVEVGVMILDEVHHENGLASLKELHSKAATLEALIVKMKAKLTLERNAINNFKEGISALKVMEKDIDKLLLFALCNKSESSFDSEALPLVVQDSNKENVPQRMIPKPTREKPVPSLNYISSSDFSKVPRHVRGHATLEQINDGIGEVNVVLQKKYKFLNQPRKLLSLKEGKKKSEYLEQAKSLKASTGYNTFFVDEDINQYSTTLKLKKKTKDNIFLVLRHLGRMKEIHKGKITFYCILSA